jgi:hypothetical protein
MRANVRHYQPKHRTVVPEQLVGFAAVMASLPDLDTRLVCFDTSVVDFTEVLEDPVSVQLGGGTGTDIHRARLARY